MPPAVPDDPRRSLSGEYDAIVVGAGFGGLGAALGLVERGARVLVCETLSYAGGCAGSFERAGERFDAGATLCAGLGEGGLFERWIARHGLAVERVLEDPVLELRAPGLALAVPRAKEDLVARFQSMPDAPREALAAFFAEQERCASALWPLLERPELHPPLGLRALVEHLRRAPRTVRALRFFGRSLERVLARFGLERFAPLRVYLDALCQITVQCSSAGAEAPLALAAIEYPHRGAGTVRGGVGELARGLVEAIRALGGEVRFHARVERVEREGELWRVTTKRGSARGPHVVLNLLPSAVRSIVRMDARAPLDRRQERVESGWSSRALYLLAPRLDASAPRHLSIVRDPARPFVEGNHVFASMRALGAGEDPSLARVTVSTHVDPRRLAALGEEERGRELDAILDSMRDALGEHARDWIDEPLLELPASPRTFERFTGRPSGLVGGFPRRRGLRSYAELAPVALPRGLHLVGDSVFPGASALSCALGGLRAAGAIERSLSTVPHRRRAGRARTAAILSPCTRPIPSPHA